MGGSNNGRLLKWKDLRKDGSQRIQHSLTPKKVEEQIMIADHLEHVEIMEGSSGGDGEPFFPLW